MKLWSVQFLGHYPVGTAAVIVADNLAQAYELAVEMLKADGLWNANNNWLIGSRFTEENLVEIDLTKPAAHMFNNGEY